LIIEALVLKCFEQQENCHGLNLIRASVAISFFEIPKNKSQIPTAARRFMEFGIFSYLGFGSSGIWNFFLFGICFKWDLEFFLICYLIGVL